VSTRNWMLRPFLAALQFLTVAPVRTAFNADDIGRSTPYFPIVGLLIGLVAALAHALLDPFFDPGVLGVLMVLALAGASAGLHLDGLADTADGFLSARPKERILEIMRDSRIGTMGVLALAAVLGLKTAALIDMDRDLRGPALFLAPLAGRCMLVLAMNALPYARTDGLAAVFLKDRRNAHALWAVGILFAGALLTLCGRGFAAASAAVAVTLLLSLWARRKIGGITGDTLGAACELAETAVLLVAAAQHRVGTSALASLAAAGAAGYALRTTWPRGDGSSPEEENGEESLP
jgi:adenosylcobinamide-GDP ribazoletransferase